MMYVHVFLLLLLHRDQCYLKILFSGRIMFFSFVQIKVDAFSAFGEKISPSYRLCRCFFFLYTLYYTFEIWKDAERM